MKYVGKSVYMDERSVDFAKSLPITVGELKTNLYAFLQNSRYRRKFISAGVGDYLGDFKAPGIYFDIKDVSFSHLDKESSL